ncbi:hypothetical protein [Tengunoibacter tsumagoiensis]|uniref:Uncharacterized protein n=1 Tax=Tengunoibacter tsumagoiensis TaxID=2014871 RepID=A0A402A9Q9_9CHLR|nr:hypothetical protein [Tengunoibacter tsumagoiensis]GCE15828.1 hypothetical protein KTT_56870 [Tengunoibacter tsumagoiensis]
MKTRIALAAYYFSIVILSALTVVIIIKLIFIPACSANNANCTADSWSIAGLAGTILGVSAAVLAIFGTLAVAGWWTLLDERVNSLVNSLFNTWKDDLNQRFDQVLSEQAQKVELTLVDFQNQFHTFQKEASTSMQGMSEVRSSMQHLVELTLDAVMLNPPQNIEAWALKTMTNFHLPEIAQKMVLSFLLSIDSIDGSEEDRGHARPGQPNTKVLYYWERASYWQKLLNDYPANGPVSPLLVGIPQPDVVDLQTEVNQKMALYRQKIALLKK